MTSKQEPIKLDFSRHLKNSARDYWWDEDFLDLMQRRLGLEKCKNALDVGCGIGHWTKRIHPFLGGESKITGIDYNAQWIKEAKNGESQNISFMEGSAYDLPFPDEIFDFVTCQTLFMHLDQPEKALKEMYRVLKKGGIIFIAEANNYGNLIRSNSGLDSLSLDERIEHARLYALLEEGKKIAGDGFMGITYQIPSLLNKLHFKEIKNYRNDGVCNMHPPYQEANQQAFIKMILDFSDQGYVFIYPRPSAEKYLDIVCNPDVKERLINLSDKLYQIYKKQISSKTFEGNFAGEVIINTAVK